jgi:protein-disulfide isomerase
MRATREMIWCGAMVAAGWSAFGVGMAQTGNSTVAWVDDGVLAPPSPRDARDMGIGRYIPDAKGRDLNGNTVSWRSGRGEKFTVVALTSVTCPMCRKFAPSLARIEATYADRGVRFVYVNVSGIDTPADMRTQAREQGFAGLYLNDHDQAIASALRAKTTTEVFVVDAAKTLVYRGAVSDQFGIGFAHDAPRQRFLEDALDAVLRGAPASVSATSAPGCVVEPPTEPTPPAAPAVTYTKDIARIIQNSCIECHRSGGVAPFSLETYESVSRRASTIRVVTEEGIMPPWFAAPPTDADGRPLESPWANDRSLSKEERGAIAAWVDAGKPRGDEADLPLPRQFPATEWTIGEPDAVFQIAEPIAIKADGIMPYQNVMVPTNLPEDRWVTAAQIIPTDKSVVHHVLVFVLPEEALNDPALRRQSAIDESRGFFAAYVPGNDAVIYPDGMAKRLPARSVLMFQIHYTPNGRATTDQLKIGFAFGEDTPRHIVRTAAVSDRRIEIPPGASNHEEAASVRMPADARLLAFMPHMHVRGKAFRYELERVPGAEREMVLDIPDYDFNWQLRYTLREPLDAPLGSTLHATAWYDNSANNPANPDPTTTVRWGAQTYDEMMLGYIEYYLLNEDPSHAEELPTGSTPRRNRGPGEAGGRGVAFDRLLSQFDANSDGRIEKREVPENLHRQFDRLDRNRDGVLTGDDFT